MITQRYIISINRLLIFLDHQIVLMLEIHSWLSPQTVSNYIILLDDLWNKPDLLPLKSWKNSPLSTLVLNRFPSYLRKPQNCQRYQDHGSFWNYPGACSPNNLLLVKYKIQRILTLIYSKRKKARLGKQSLS